MSASTIFYLSTCVRRGRKNKSMEKMDEEPNEKTTALRSVHPFGDVNGQV